MIEITYRKAMGGQLLVDRVDPGDGETVADAVYRAMDDAIGDTDGGYLINVERDGSTVL